MKRLLRQPLNFLQKMLEQHYLTQEQQDQLKNLSQNLQQMLETAGLPKTKAQDLTIDLIRKAQRALYPRKKTRAAVEIVDSVVDDGKIYLLLRPQAAEKDPRIILKNYLERKPAYPPIDRWAIELGYGSTRLGDQYHCRVIGTEKQQKQTVKQTVRSIDSLSKEQQLELLAKLQAKAG